MIKRFASLLILLLTITAIGHAATIPISGTIVLANGNRMNGKVRMTLSHPGRDSTDSTIVVPSAVEWNVANGSLPSSARIVPNDQIQPANTYYLTEYFSAAGQKVMQNAFYVAGSSFNIGQAIPTPVTTSNLSFGSFTGLDQVTTKRLNSVRYCDQFPGATAGLKIAAAIADLPSTGGVADCRSIVGAQSITSTITVSKPVDLLLGAATISVSAGTAFTVTAAFNVQGAGRGYTILQQTSASSTVFSVSTTAPFQLHDVNIYGSPQTSGAAVILDSPSTENQFSDISNNIFRYQWIAIDVRNAQVFHITDNEVDGIQFDGIKLADSYNADGLDSFISDNTFSCATPTGHTGIHHITGGGLSLAHNKFLVCDHGYHLKWASNTDSSQIQIVNNRFDLNAVSNVWIEREASNTGTVSSIQIEGNYFNSSSIYPGSPILFSSTPTAFAYFPQIVGNHIQLNDSGKTAIVFAGTSGDIATISGNIMYGQGGSGGINIGANYTQMNIGINNNLTATPNTITAGAMRGAYLPDKLGVGIEPTVTLTQQVEIPNATYYGTRTAANVTQQLIGMDSSNNVIIAPNNQPIVTGTGAFTAQGTMSATRYKTTNNCSSVAAPAVCGGASAGTISMAAGGATVTVNTTAVTALSQIFVRVNNAKNIGVTCNTGAAMAQNYWADTIVASTSFRISTSAAPVTDPACLDFLIVN